eukprot:scaffold370347_cov19-Prasinocladus_malaysianus.AAC.1
MAGYEYEYDRNLSDPHCVLALQQDAAQHIPESPVMLDASPSSCKFDHVVSFGVLLEYPPPR